MAATKWQVYNSAKISLMTGAINLEAATIRMKLMAAAKAAVVSAYTRVLFTSLTHIATNLVVPILSVTGNVVTTGTSAKEIKFDSTACVFSISGGAVSCLYAVVGVSNGAAIAWSKLTSTGVVTVPDGNILTITPAATGYFTLTGGVTA
jgi:hypothetical protein